MYESFFGFRERPFPAAPLAAAYYPSGSMEHARQQIERCIDRAEGIAMVVGGAGTGKTLLLQVLANSFREKFWVATLGSTSICSRRALLQNILFELKLPYREMEEGELRLSLIDHLQPSRECPHGMVLLVDEAHTLPLRLLEEIRLITNLVREGQPRIRLVLAGSPSLEERFTSPKLESFNQRIVARTYLQHFNAAETAAYVRQQITRVGGRAEAIFDDSALQALFRATDGICRLINQVGDHAMILAAAGGKSRITAAGVQEAWADLQQLPVPWNGETMSASAAIEFGALDEPVDAIASAEEALGELEEHVDELHDEFVAEEIEEFRPAAKSPEIEIVFPTKQELFGSDFYDEEMVIDRLATLDAKLLPVKNEVKTPLGEAFRREVLGATDSPPALKLVSAEHVKEEIAQERDSKPSAKSPLGEKLAEFKRKQAAPVLPEIEEEVDEEIALADEEPLDVISFDGADDPVYPEPLETVEHLSVVIASIDDAEPTGSAPPPKSAKRPQFRNLFSKLGRKS